MKIAYLFAAAVAFAAVPGSAAAQTGDYTTDREERRETVIITEAPEDRDAARDRDLDRAERERDGERRGNTARGITVGALGGVEGYTGSLAPRIEPGAAWGVGLGLQPSHFVGLELGYTGAANQIGGNEVFGVGGANMIRNGAHANVKVSLTARRVEPFVFSGIGINRMDFRGGTPQDFNRDLYGQVPVGGGLNFHVGNFTAGARVSYNMLFDRDFVDPAATQPNSLGIDNKQSGDTWNGLLQIGANFL
ncbi:MAG: hypothetical protein ACK4N5_14965 [Myxococcales bacterium]